MADTKVTSHTSDLNGTTVMQQMTASCSGALLTALFMTPLDVVKVRLQAQSRHQARHAQSTCFVYSTGLMDHTCILRKNLVRDGKRVTCAEWYARNGGPYYGTWDAMRKIARREGFTSLWSGLPPTLVMAVPATIFYFTTYDSLMYYARGTLGIDSPYLPAVAGASARLAVVTLISPLELIRTKIQSEQLSYSRVAVALRDVVRSDGVRMGLFRGWSSTVLRDVPFSGIYWLSYDNLKRSIIRRYQLDSGNLLVWTGAGTISGTIAAVCTLPFDVVKTHRQIEIGEATIQEAAAVNRQSTISIMQRLYSRQGVGGLFVGLLPRILKVAPACAIMIGSYEYLKSFFQEKNRRQNKL